MENDATEDNWENSTAYKDLVIIAVLAIFTFVIATVFDLFELLVGWTRLYEKLDIDEIFTVLIILAFAFGIFSLRRWRELDRELNWRKRVGDYPRLFENSLDGIYRSTADGKFIDVNPALVKMLGYESKEELLSVNIPKDIYFSESERPLKGERGTLHVNRLKRKDGTPIWVETSSRVISKEKGNIIYEGIVRDITKRKEMEDKLHRKLDEFEQWQKLTVDRELKMKELKKEINELKEKLKNYETS